MRFFFFTTLLIVFSRMGHAQSTGFGKPICWYTIYNPWASFIGADGPIFTVYEGGQVIYWKGQQYHMVNLDKGGVAELLSKLSLSDTFFVRSRYISASRTTDQPDYVFRTNLDTLKSFTIYGSMNDTRVLSKIPAPLKAVYDFVTTFNDDRSVNWLPPKIEVLLSEYDYSPEKPIHWPAGWPDLKSPDTRRWEGGASLYLAARHFSHLQQLLKARKEKQAFLINDHKYFAGYRLPLPGVDSILASRRR